jgi:hypothetical protein
MSLNDLKDEFGPEIADMAAAANSSLPLTVPQITATFNEQQLADLQKLTTEVNAESDRESKLLKLKDNAAAAFDLLKGMGVVQ